MKSAAICLLVSMLAGCVSIQSNTKSDAVPTFGRILVVTKMRRAPDTYVLHFARAFPANYQVCTLALSPLSFDNPDEVIRQRVQDCKSDVILTLELSKTGHSGRYNSANYEFNAEMRSAATNQPFWKALIYSNPTLGEELPPRSLVKRLLNDHVIEGKLPTSESLQTLN
jgi:hypothetical protein